MVLDAAVREQVVRCVEDCVPSLPAAAAAGSSGAAGSGDSDWRLDGRAASTLLVLLERQLQTGDGGEVYVGEAHDVLWLKLQAGHAQTRLLALQLADKLFRELRPFRQRLCARFQMFVELTVGHSGTRPLPPPVEVAEALRERALEVLERWRDAYGRAYPQVITAVRYLRDVLGLRLPELRARAAARAARADAHRARSAAAAARRFSALPGELQALRDEVRPLLAELSNSVALLSGAAPVDPGVGSTSSGGGAAADDAVEWEDVPATAPTRAGMGAPAAAAAAGGTSGLSAYAAAAAPPLPSSAGGVCVGAGVDVDAALTAARARLGGHVADELAAAAGAAARGLTGAAVPRLRAWLRTLVQLDTQQRGGSGGDVSGGVLPRRAASAAEDGRGGGGGGVCPDPSEVGRLMRDVVGLRNSIQAALAAAAAAGVGAAAPSEDDDGIGGGGSSAAVPSRAVDVSFGLDSLDRDSDSADSSGDSGSGRDADSTLERGGGGGSSLALTSAAVGEGGAGHSGQPGVADARHGRRRGRLPGGVVLSGRGGHVTLGAGLPPAAPGGPPRRRSGSAAAAAAAAVVDERLAAAAARVSYNDHVLAGAGDEAMARRLQDEQAGQQRQQQQREQQAAAARPTKRAKLTGKARIKKRLGLA